MLPLTQSVEEKRSDHDCCQVGTGARPVVRDRVDAMSEWVAVAAGDVAVDEDRLMTRFLRHVREGA